MQLILNGSTIELQKNSEGKFGIESLKTLAENVFFTAKNIHARLKDGKLSWLESILTGSELIGLGKDIISDLKQLESEVKELTADELKQLTLFIIKLTGMDALKAGVFIEKILLGTISTIYAGIEIYHAADELF
jgi:hypothetical protein